MLVGHGQLVEEAEDAGFVSHQYTLSNLRTCFSIEIYIKTCLKMRFH